MTSTEMSEWICPLCGQTWEVSGLLVFTGKWEDFHARGCPALGHEHAGDDAA